MVMTYDESLAKVREELGKRNLWSAQAANMATGHYNLDKLWSRVWNYDLAASSVRASEFAGKAADAAKDSAETSKQQSKTARNAMYVAIGSLVLNIILFIFKFK